VLAQWTAHSNRSTAAPYTIYNNGAAVSAPVTKDQTVNGGDFNSLGTYWLEAGTVEVVLNDSADGVVIADAVKIVSEPPPTGLIIDNTDSGFSTVGTWGTSSYSPGYFGSDYRTGAPGNGSLSASWTFSLTSSGNCEVLAQWAAHSNRSTAAPYTIYNNGTAVSAPITRDQTVNGGAFRTLGTFWLEAGSVEVRLNNAPDGYVIADAVNLVPLF
jgi:hypothetical protein